MYFKVFQKIDLCFYIYFLIKYFIKMSIQVKYNIGDDKDTINFESFDKIIDYDKVVCISCCYNQLNKLPKLPKKLQNLYCGYNRLISLPELPIKLRYLYCSSNELTSLPELPIKFQELWCENNRLTS